MMASPIRGVMRRVMGVLSTGKRMGSVPLPLDWELLLDCDEYLVL